MIATPTSAGPAPLAPRHWPMWLLIGAMAALARLPWPLQRGLGRGLGAFLRLAMGSRRRVAARNLELCFPGMDPAARQRLLRANFAALGVGLFEFARAWWGRLPVLPARVQLQGLEHLEAAVAAGRGVILVSGHFTTLEICGRLLCRHVPLAGMYRPHSQPALEWAVKRGRLRYASAMFSREELRAPARPAAGNGAGSAIPRPAGRTAGRRAPRDRPRVPGSAPSRSA